MFFYNLYKALEKPATTKYGYLMQGLLLFNLIINLIVSILPDWLNFSNEVLIICNYINRITIFIFCVELLFRYCLIGFDSRYRGFFGKIKFTFTPLIIIDILSITPFFIVGINNIVIIKILRFLKYVRVLKFFRLRHTIKKIFSFSFFATSHISIQFIILFIFSIICISCFSFLFNNDRLSMMVFLDPPALAEISDKKQLILGVVELILGLIIGGALISIITELLTNISISIKEGSYPYKGKNHIVIINYNASVDFLLQELNFYYKNFSQQKDIVFFLPNEGSIKDLSQKFKKYSNLSIYFIKGDCFNWGSYKKLCINYAEKLIMLGDRKSDFYFYNKKILRFLISHPCFLNKNIHIIIESNCKDDKFIYSSIIEDSQVSKNTNSIVINYQNILQSFFNRSIVEPDYFKVYSKILSFEDYCINVVDVDSFFMKVNTTSFKEIYYGVRFGIVIGYIHNGSIILKPKSDSKVSIRDKLIIIMHSQSDVFFNSNYNTSISSSLLINEPSSKVNRKICVVGDYERINKIGLYEFLTKESINDLDIIIQEDNRSYFNLEFWNKILVKNYDVIILNFEDDFEFVLTMYLRNQFKNINFLSKMVNIMHDTINYQLVNTNKYPNNIIISEKIVGGFLAQATFNPYFEEIFKELTHTDGSEFYILSHNNYKDLLLLPFNEIRDIFFQNDMIYIGCIRNGKFYINEQYLYETDDIVILAEGD